MCHSSLDGNVTQNSNVYLLCWFYYVEAAYAKEVQRSGFYLGLLDLALLGIKKKKEIRLVFHDDDFKDAPPIKNLKEVISVMYPDAGPCFNFESDSAPWYIGVTKANYARAPQRQLDHFVALFLKEEIGDGMWDLVTSSHEKKFQKRYDFLLRQIQENDDSDEEFVRSLYDHFQPLENQKAFVNAMKTLSLRSVLVPGDGNCALWTILALEVGPVAGNQVGTMQEVMELRKDACVVYKKLLL